MKLQIKLLERDPLFIQVEPDVFVAVIKEMMYQQLRIPLDEQRLIFQGQILKDDRMITYYEGIGEGSKIHLLMIAKKNYPLYKTVYEMLRPHYTEKETHKILSIFMRRVYDSFRQLSLHDLERIAHEALMEKSTFPEPERMIID